MAATELYSINLVNSEYMKALHNYYTLSDCNSESVQISVDGEQGSSFAKKVAGDFNPIHNADSKRFCVPGDLLFAIALEQYGLYQNMEFQFLGLVSAGTVLQYPLVDTTSSAVPLHVVNEKGRAILDIEYSGNCSCDRTQIEPVMTAYVAFSGQNFPHILVPLMQQQNVMINPSRPLVVYESMSFNLHHFDFDMLDVELGETSLQVVGKRGNVALHFTLTSNDRVIGTGVKRLVLSGLREYDATVVKSLCEAYLASKESGASM